jgi:hypothetical protein
MGQASYENGIACSNFTLTVMNLNTSENWNADIRAGYNYYKLVLDRSDVHAGDVLQFAARNTDADTINISEYQLNDTDRWSLQYNITFISVDVIVLILDPDGLIHYQPVYIKNESTATVFNATAIACELSNQTFESTGDNVTRVDGIERPSVHLYDESGGWTNATQNQRLKKGAIIIWSRGDEELPELSFVLLPDLSITGEMTIGSDPHVKFMTTVAATIANRGAPISDEFDVALVEDGKVIDIRTLPPLDSMEDTTVTFEWVAEDSGDHAIGIRIDPDDLVDELNEYDNDISRDVVVGETMIIKVPQDYQSIQDAVGNVTAYGVIYIDKGDYGGFTIKDTQSGIQVYDSDNISLTNLVVTHRSHSKNAYLLKIDNSVDCVISDNFMSGNQSPAYWAFRYATSGVLIVSDNNTLCRNTISNCQYTVKLQGDNNIVYANNLFFTEAGGNPEYPFSENTFALDAGHNNHWNSTIPISYRHNNKTFTNYIGNYWDGWIDEDLDDDGIWDAPYNISYTARHYPIWDPRYNISARDYYPLRKPYAEEYALNVKSISLFAEDNRCQSKSHDQLRGDRIKRG